MAKMKYFSMFSGIGGFEFGIQQSNYDFECIGYSEIDKYARSIYEKHYPNHINHGDAREIQTDNLPNFDFLVGGFPCQAFSNAGKKRGFDDTRGTLFFEIARILKDKKPKYFLLENVKGLLHNNHGKTFKRILGIFASLGYNVQWQMYNSKNYGVPQNRERIFLKGYLGSECGEKVLSVRRTNKEINIPTLDRINNENLKIRTNTKKGYKEAYVNDGVRLDRLDQVNGGRGRVHYGSTGTLMCHGNWGTVDQDYRIRRLTPIECERLQAFPDGWTRYGVDGEEISDTQRYKCLGNAVTTTVVTAIINEMFGGLN